MILLQNFSKYHFRKRFSIDFKSSPSKLCQLFGVGQVNAWDSTRWQLLSCHVLRVVWRGVLPDDLLLDYCLMINVLLVICQSQRTALEGTNKRPRISTVNCSSLL